MCLLFRVAVFVFPPNNVTGRQEGMNNIKRCVHTGATHNLEGLDSMRAHPITLVGLVYVHVPKCNHPISVTDESH